MSLDVNISEPDEFNCHELHSTIDEVAKIKGFDKYSYHVDFVCGKGENYIANIFRSFLFCDETDKSESVIVKTLINTERRDLFYELHRREVDAYEKVISKFEILQQDIGVEERVTFPECILTVKEKSKEVIILEDMQVKGFATDRNVANTSLEYTQVIAVLKELAKFHSLTFIYEKHEPDNFNELKKEFEDIIFSKKFLDKTKLRDYFHESFGTSVSLVENFEAKSKLVGIERKLLDILRFYCEPETNNVLCHGDCWTNNIMFKYDADKPTQVCLIDFQAMRYANPMTDILHFIYLCTDSTFRKIHFDDLINIYYDTLKTFLDTHDIDITLLYNIEQYKADIEKFQPYGLLVALMELRLFINSSDNERLQGRGPGVVDVGEIDYLKVRVNDIVNECVDNGVIDRLVDRINCK